MAVNQSYDSYRRFKDICVKNYDKQTFISRKFKMRRDIFWSMLLLGVQLCLQTSVFSLLYQVEAYIDGISDEKWGYVTVRENAHMFWWLYGAQSKERNQLPLVLWLQGGPGGSGTGFGNFEEIGPLDRNLKPRNTSWTLKTNLLFIDNPVGAGFSYVTNPEAFTRNVSQIANDLLVIFSTFLDTFPIFKENPFYIFCESYGGKMAAVFGKRLHEAIEQQVIDCNFKGVALGDSSISPLDAVLSWGAYLYQFNLLDQRDLAVVEEAAALTALAFEVGEYEKSTEYFSDVQTLLGLVTDNVNVYNVLQHNSPPVSQLSDSLEKLFHRHVAVYYQDSLADFMDTVIRKKLEIIPDNVKWGAQSRNLFKYQAEDFLKPVIEAVDYLILQGLNVVVYQGQLDMICNTPSADTWINKLKWTGLKNFNDAKRKALYVESKKGQTQAFLKSYENFSFYYILNSGHMVPLDNGPMALKMLGQIINVE